MTLQNYRKLDLKIRRIFNPQAGLLESNTAQAEPVSEAPLDRDYNPSRLPDLMRRWARRYTTAQGGPDPLVTILRVEPLSPAQISQIPDLAIEIKPGDEPLMVYMLTASPLRTRGPRGSQPRINGQLYNSELYYIRAVVADADVRSVHRVDTLDFEYGLNVLQDVPRSLGLSLPQLQQIAQEMLQAADAHAHESIQEAAPWRRPSRAKDTTHQLDLDFTAKPEPPKPEPPKKRIPIDPSDIYTVLPRSEWRKFEQELDRYIIDDNWDSTITNGHNVESRIVGVLQNEVDGKIFYTVIYIMVHAEALGKSTYKKSHTSAPIDSWWTLATAYFADSRGKLMSLLKRQRQNVAYGRAGNYDTRKGPPKLPDKRPRFYIYERYLMKNPSVIDPRSVPISPVAQQKRLERVQDDNAAIHYSRQLDGYTSYRRYYRLDDLPSPSMVRSMGKALWNEVARKVGQPEFDEQDIPVELLPPEGQWPYGTVARDFDDHYDDERFEESRDPRRDREHSPHAHTPFVDGPTDRHMERYLTRQLERFEREMIESCLDARPAHPTASLPHHLHAQVSHMEMLRAVEQQAQSSHLFAGSPLKVIALDPVVGPFGPNGYLATALWRRSDTDPVQLYALPVSSSGAWDGSYINTPALAPTPHWQSYLRELRVMTQLAHRSASRLTSMDLKRAIRRYTATTIAVQEAIAYNDKGEVELDYLRDSGRKREKGELRTAMRKSSKKDGQRVKGYQRTLKIAPEFTMPVIGAYSRTRDLPQELMQAIKAGSFVGSDQFIRRTAFYLATVLKNRGIHPDCFLPLPSRAGFPERLVRALKDYYPQAKLLAPPPKDGTVSSVWVVKRRAKAQTFYQSYTPDKRTKGTVIIVDDWFVTGASIAAVAERLVAAELDSLIPGPIDQVIGLVLGVSSR